VNGNGNNHEAGLNPEPNEGGKGEATNDEAGSSEEIAE
jgi:hypothetical protein